MSRGDRRFWTLKVRRGGPVAFSMRNAPARRFPLVWARETISERIRESLSRSAVSKGGRNILGLHPRWTAGERPPVLERRGRLTADERKSALEALKSLGVEVDHEMSTLAFTHLPQLASELALSIYDTTYPELALRRKLPLACMDGPGPLRGELPGAT